MRTFIAVNVADHVLNEVDKLIVKMQNGIVRTGCKLNWVDTENMHLTLKFLGEIDESQAEKVIEVLGNVSIKYSPFVIKFNGLGMFPNKKSPKVLWHGLTKGEHHLKELQLLIDSELNKVGFEKEDREFHPHLTLARINFVKGGSGLDNIVNIYHNYSSGECSIDKITFYKSTLTPNGPIYEVLSEHPLSVY